MKTLYCLFAFIIFSIVAHFFMLKHDYESAPHPYVVEVTYLGRNCGGSCYYYALVNYKGTTQEINIGRNNYNDMVVGKSYDLSPSFNWNLGAYGTAYSIETYSPWHKGIISRFLSLVIHTILLLVTFLEIRDIHKKKKVKKTSHTPSFH